MKAKILFILIVLFFIGAAGYANAQSIGYQVGKIFGSASSGYSILGKLSIGGASPSFIGIEDVGSTLPTVSNGTNGWFFDVGAPYEQRTGTQTSITGYYSRVSDMIYSADFLSGVDGALIDSTTLFEEHFIGMAYTSGTKPTVRMRTGGILNITASTTNFTYNGCFFPKDPTNSPFRLTFPFYAVFIFKMNVYPSANVSLATFGLFNSSDMGAATESISLAITNTPKYQIQATAGTLDLATATDITTFHTFVIYANGANYDCYLDGTRVATQADIAIANISTWGGVWCIAGANRYNAGTNTDFDLDLIQVVQPRYIGRSGL